MAFETLVKHFCHISGSFCTFPKQSLDWGVLTVLFKGPWKVHRSVRCLCPVIFIDRLRTWWGSHRSRLCRIVARVTFDGKTHVILHILFQIGSGPLGVSRVPAGCLLGVSWVPAGRLLGASWVLQDDSRWFQMTPDASRWFQKTPDDSRWFQMTPDDSRCLKMTPEDSRWLNASRCLQMIPNASRWFPMPPDDSRWFQMPPEESNWVQMPPDHSRWLQMPPDASRWLQGTPGDSFAIGILSNKILICLEWNEDFLLPSWTPNIMRIFNWPNEDFYLTKFGFFMGLLSPRANEDF